MPVGSACCVEAIRIGTLPEVAVRDGDGLQGSHALLGRGSVAPRASGPAFFAGPVPAELHMRQDAVLRAQGDRAPPWRTGSPVIAITGAFQLPRKLTRHATSRSWGFLRAQECACTNSATYTAQDPSPDARPGTGDGNASAASAVTSDSVLALAAMYRSGRTRTALVSNPASAAARAEPSMHSTTGTVAATWRGKVPRTISAGLNPTASSSKRPSSSTGCGNNRPLCGVSAGIKPPTSLNPNGGEMVSMLATPVSSRDSRTMSTPCPSR